MSLAALLFDFALWSGIVFLCARRFDLDLGLRRPVMAGSWPWIASFVAWIVAEWTLSLFHEVEVDAEWAAWVDTWPAGANMVESILLAPLAEELLFRGAMFSALIRRWGIAAAAVVPSLLWAVMHTQYEGWFVASLAGSGMLLAVIRWKTNSLYVPILLHAASNAVYFFV